MTQDSELTGVLARAILTTPGQYRFFVPAAAREAKRDALRRAAAGTDRKVVTRTCDDTMWVTVS